jgi:hypothetical protein
MGIPLRITDPFPGEHGEREPGMMWRYPPGDIPGRESWWIVLPNWKPDPGGYMEISWRTTDRATREPHELWGVTGDPPLITVDVSIDVECWTTPPGGGDPVRDGSYWHGWIHAGELVDVP